MAKEAGAFRCAATEQLRSERSEHGGARAGRPTRLRWGGETLVAGRARAVVANRNPGEYAPAAERARELVPSKNKRFAEFARVVALAPRALIAEFDLDSDLDSESDSEGEGGDEEGFFGEGAASSAPTTTPTTTPRRRRCTASSPRWRVSASVSGRICSPIPGLI